MPNYSYQAINESGKNVTGTLEAESMDVANSLIFARGLIPSKLRLIKVGTGDNYFCPRPDTVKT